MSTPAGVRARYRHRLPDGRLQCDLCNLGCRFCQNWDISKSREVDTLADAATPEQLAVAAERLGCRSVAFTYNDPVIFLEYAVDTADACRARGIASVAVTAGYVCPESRTELFAHVDAVNVDLKAFDDGFYRTVCGGRPAPVLETIEYVARDTDVWLEPTTLLIPGLNDSDAELDGPDRGRMSRVLSARPLSQRSPARLLDLRTSADACGDFRHASATAPSPSSRDSPRSRSASDRMHAGRRGRMLRSGERRCHRS